MKLFGITVSRDYEEMKKWRRESLLDKENVEFLIEHGATRVFRSKFIWRIGGSPYTLYSLSLAKALYSIVCIFRNRLFGRLSRLVA